MRLAFALAAVLLSRPASAAAPDASARKALAAGVRAYHRLDLRSALAKFDEAMEAFPDWKTAAGYRATCRWTMGDPGGASEDARLAAKLKPNDGASFAARGKARLVLRDYEGALGDFRAAREADATSVEGPLGEGSTLSAQGKLREALKALDKASALDPGSAAVLLMRGSVKDRLRDFRGAAEDYGSVLEINPKFSWASLSRGKSRRELKDYRAAESDFSSFLEEYPEHEDAHYLRSNVRFLLGDYRGAETDLTAVIAANPRRGLAYSNRGQARAALGDKTGALMDLRKALELDPSRRDKIQTAIDALESGGREEAAPAVEEEPAPSPARAPAPAPRARRSAPTFGDDPPEATVTLEEEGTPRAARRPAVPTRDLDDEVSAPPPERKPEPGPDRGRRRGEAPPERHTGEEESLFIDR